MEEDDRLSERKKVRAQIPKLSVLSAYYEGC
jgi:hypothetical protein